jgi:hypothetical protein
MAIFYQYPPSYPPKKKRLASALDLSPARRWASVIGKFKRREGGKEAGGIFKRPEIDGGAFRSRAACRIHRMTLRPEFLCQPSVRVNACPRKAKFRYADANPDRPSLFGKVAGGIGSAGHVASLAGLARGGEAFGWLSLDQIGQSKGHPLPQAGLLFH